MKNLFFLLAFFPLFCFCQSGGMNIRNLQVGESIFIGTSSSVTLEKEMIKLPPLTNERILEIVNPPRGTVIFSDERNQLLMYNGTQWTSFDGSPVSISSSCNGTFYDIDGNLFHGVLIGSQCWMDRNLSVIHYPDGDPVPLIFDADKWADLAGTNYDDGCCFPDNASDSDYGALYTYAAAIGEAWFHDHAEGQGICPDGWHLPDFYEWEQMINALGDNPAGKLKEIGYTHWTVPNTGATNSSGFTALPGGLRGSYNGNFSGSGNGGYWWVTGNITNSDDSIAWIRILYNNSSEESGDVFSKSVGASVRCLRN